MRPIMFSIVMCVFGASAVLGAEAGAEKGWRQRQFIITFWCPPPATDEALARVAAEHYNLTWVSPDGLDLAAKHGLRAMLTSPLLSPDVLDDAARRAQLDALIERVRSHPALEAYYLTDEPSAGAFPSWGRMVAYLRERDPTRLAYINLFPTYANEQQLGVTTADTARARVGYPRDWAGVQPDDPVVLRYREHLKRFVEIVKPDLISYDHYHFFKTGDGREYFLNLALIREAAQAAGKPFLNIVQGGDSEKVWRRPTAAEMRWLAFTTLAYGGRGISYFTYWYPGGLYQDGRPTPLAGEVARVNAEVARFGPALLELDSVGVYHTPPLPYGSQAVPAEAPVRPVGEGEFVLGLFGKAGKTTAFMVVNRSYRQEADAAVRVTLPGRGLEELDRRTGAWSKGPPLPADRIVRLRLAPGDGRLLRIAD